MLPLPPALLATLLLFQSTSLLGTLFLKNRCKHPSIPRFLHSDGSGEIILLTEEKTTRGPGDFCPRVCFEADHTNDEDENPSESMTVLTLNKRRVNKEGSNKSCPGHDLALNCLLQCPDFWPGCQFDAPLSPLAFSIPFQVVLSLFIRFCFTVKLSLLYVPATPNPHFSDSVFQVL